MVTSIAAALALILALLSYGKPTKQNFLNQVKIQCNP